MPLDAYSKMYKMCRTCYFSDPEIQKQKRDVKARIFAEVDEKFKAEMGEQAFQRMKQQEACKPALYQCSKCSEKAGHPKFHREGSGMYERHLGYRT
jgi:hypothetical protein